jgi:hypothetical protein
MILALAFKPRMKNGHLVGVRTGAVATGSGGTFETERDFLIRSLSRIIGF